MPEGTAVDRTYKALLKEGKSEESAARIAQAQTGEALATGKPPKHENCEIENAFSKWQIDFLRKEFDPINRPLNNMEIEKVRNLCMRAKIEDCKAIAEAGIKNISDIAKSVLQQRKYMGNTSFQNGRTRALNHIMNRAGRVGVKLGNAPMDKLKRALAKTPADDEAAGYKDRLSGFYDKWYRYNRSDDGAAYDRGCKKAVDSGKCPDHFQLIEGYRNV